MSDLPFDFELLLLGAIPSLVQIIKARLAGAPKWVLPLLAIGLGVGGNLLWQWIEALVTGGQLDAASASLVGAVLGGCSTAVYSTLREGQKGSRIKRTGPTGYDSELQEPRGGLGL